jgi:hypothetical protein
MTSIHTELDTSLRATEERLATPRVPGELEGWAADVAESLRRVHEMLTRVRSTEHASLFASIEEADPGLMSRIEELRTADGEHGRELGVLAERFDALRAGLEKSDLPEARVESPIETLIDETVLLLFRVRRSEVALATWLVESVDRDRGEGD